MWDWYEHVTGLLTPHASSKQNYHMTTSAYLIFVAMKHDPYSTLPRTYAISEISSLPLLPTSATANPHRWPWPLLFLLPAKHHLHLLQASLFLAQWQNCFNSPCRSEWVRPDSTGYSCHIFKLPSFPACERCLFSQFRSGISSYVNRRSRPCSIWPILDSVIDIRKRR